MLDHMGEVLVQKGSWFRKYVRMLGEELLGVRILKTKYETGFSAACARFLTLCWLHELFWCSKFLVAGCLAFGVWQQSWYRYSVVFLSESFMFLCFAGVVTLFWLMKSYHSFPPLPNHPPPPPTHNHKKEEKKNHIKFKVLKYTPIHCSVWVECEYIPAEFNCYLVVKFSSLG